jgi:hypothetical protein
VLATHRPNAVEPALEADRGAVARVLVVEACMITPDHDSGSVRMQAMLELMVGLGCKVSFVADNLEYRQPYVRDLQQAGVEVWHHPFVASVEQLLRERGGEYDLIVLCRHYIAINYIDAVRVSRRGRASSSTRSTCTTCASSAWPSWSNRPRWRGRPPPRAARSWGSSPGPTSRWW